MSEYDLAVVGGGPAGAAAAIEAAGLGLRCLLFDEGSDAGGQVYRPPAFAAATGGPDAAAGAALRAGLAGSAVERAFGHRVWFAGPAAEAAGFELQAVGPEGNRRVTARALLAAAGTSERVFPCAGWTLPGVTGLAAATILLKSQKVLPGRRVVVAGCGPLLPLVAVGILELGGAVAALVDLNGPADWLAALPGLAARPDLALRGLGWLARLRRAGVPLYTRWGVRAVSGREAVEAVEIGPVEADWRPSRQRPALRIEADALCLGHGLLPASELTRLLGAAHAYRPEAGGWLPVLDEAGRTSLPLLYAAGDGARLLGAGAAPLAGRLAALAAARDLGRLSEAAFAQRAAPLRRRLRRAARFGTAMARLCTPRPGLVEGLGADAVACRCEELTRGELGAAIAAGAGSLAALKAATRCGMGPCGGRLCNATAHALLAAAGRSAAEIGAPSARPPLRPVPLAALTGSFDYADVPIRELSPR
ncbi:Thioredoxin reductase [Tistlia consotensis]|uniref:Thioredoxin reductase n=1 Tax=Tistlia consotensis USBA 355 TaxID=560819 RepID=A0A1Y6C7T8_9PROT|nr:FAD-dependent oxidoreductase [Tistlia consotensis]SMF38883.1 Thioredoxin reductase [Tistlia consotensis USBA 355]SNR36754.1 Thioredoxin reductase [Tistlia consotensis]